MNDEKLVRRLNRAIGQIDAIRKKIESGKDKDCVKTLQQLKASINALKKFGEAYMSTHLETCLSVDTDRNQLKAQLDQVIKGVFSL